MERKYKTKDQKKIERLEKRLSETEAELSQVKKDRKRLNYAVERLEREKAKALNTLTPAAIDLICQYSDKVTAKEKQNEELNAIISEREKEIADKEEQYNALLSKYNEKKADEDEIRKQIWGDKKKFENDVTNRTLEKITYLWDGIYHQSKDDRDALKKFNDGEYYYTDLLKGYSNHILFAMFSIDTLIIRINPNNGRELTEIDMYAIKHYLGFCYEQRTYKSALKELEDFKNANPNCPNDKLAEWVYNKGMELLPLYRDKIF